MTDGKGAFSSVRLLSGHRERERGMRDGVGNGLDC